VDELSPPSHLVLSTETPAKAASDLRGSLVCSGLIPALWCGAYYLFFTPEFRSLAVLLFLQTIYFFLGLLPISGLWRGTWTFDDQGVTKRSKKGQATSLSWKQIDRVRWEGIKTLKGQKVTIRLFLPRFTSAQKAKVLSLVESKLAERFDLGPVPRKPASPAINLDLSFPRWRIVAATYAAVTAGFIAFALAMALAPLGGTEFLLKVIRPLCLGILIVGSSMLIIPMLLIGLLFGYTLWADYQNTHCWKRKVAQIHPAWPWRIPRQESVAQAWKGHARKDLEDWRL
jgi:hypothetical protein